MSEEIKGQIEWLMDLRDVIEAGDTPTAIDTINAAVDMLTKQLGDT